jgi:hypothetical protein
MTDLDRLSIPDEPNAITIMRKKDIKKAGVPGPAEVARAHSRLAILPNPNDPTLSSGDKYVQSPWPVVPAVAVNPNTWEDAELAVVNLNDLSGTDPFLKRKNVGKHIDAMAQALSDYRSYALVVEVDGSMIIIDGHHRLMAAWLLGQETAPVWKVEL